MSAINLSGNASGSGTFTIASPNSNTSYTLALPEEAGTITTSNSPYSTFRNRIINGDMRIDQRNAGASVNLSATSQYTIDRWDVRLGTSTGSTTQQSTTAPAGFTNSLLLTIGTGASPSASAGTGYLDQTIEGFNTADLGWGAAGAKTITLSFWVRSSLTGSFGVCVTNDGINPSYPTSYTINSANTWEYKTITVPGPTTGTFNTNNAGGIRLFFDWGNGSNFKGTADTWANADYRGGATGTSSICATSGATWYITGVQLEVGSVATPFERRPYGTELSLCQRYFYLHSGSTNKALGAGAATGTTQVNGIVYFPVSMRASPSLYSTLSATDKFRFNSNVDSNSNSDMSLGDVGLSFAGYSVGGFSGLTTGYAGAIRRYNATGVLGFTAEL